jgi:2,4-dienoyl-CoA reductase-like NADH-dependent reductase (Old Yellow Enzyme family)
MTRDDLDQVFGEFVRAAQMAARAGFDLLELHCAHGYLLSSFITPLTNHRTDAYGGSLENRLRFPLEVIARTRAEVGKDFPILVKMNLDDACRGGLTIDDAVRIGQAFEAAGVDALVTSAGRSPGNTSFIFRGGSPIPYMVERLRNPFMKLSLTLFGRFQFPPMPYQELYLLDMARKLRAAVKCPVVYLGGVSSVAALETVMREGFDFVAMGRALIFDPQMINRIRTDPSYRNGCTHCNICTALIYDPNGVHCVLTGR